MTSQPTNNTQYLKDDELLNKIFDVAAYDYIPEELHKAAAIPSNIYDEAVIKVKARRLEIIAQYREQREREILESLLTSNKVRTISVPDWQSETGEIEIISTRWIKQKLDALTQSPKKKGSE